MSLRFDPGVRPSAVTIQVDNQELQAFPGESLAAALWATGIRTLRYSPKDNTARGAFCWMGVCQECLVSVDGRRTLACQQPVYAAMRVITGAPSHDG